MERPLLSPLGYQVYDACMLLLPVQVPFATNVTCNKTCVFDLEDNVFFNLEDSVITRARRSYVATDPDLLKVVP